MTDFEDYLGRLTAICEDINHERQELDDPIEYRVGRGDELGLMGATERYQPAVRLGNAEAGGMIVWFWEDGILEARFWGPDPRPGDVIVMTIRGAAYATGDFQVAETINDVM